MSARRSSFWSSSRKDSTTKHPSKLKSWFTNLRPPAPASSPRAQIQSELLSTLPIEIRCQIYGHILNSYGTVQHIGLLYNGKLAHMHCAVPTSHTYFQDHNARSNDVCVPDCVTYNDHYCKSMKNGWEVVPLLLSCKKIYVEFVDLLYSTTIFHLPIYVAAQMIATVPAPHLALAHLRLSFHVSYPMYLPYLEWPNGVTTDNTSPKRVRADEADWEGFWRALSRLQVRTLIVEIIDDGIRVPEQTLLEPLREVSAELFEVVLPWPACLKTSGEFGDAAFTVRRPPEGVDLMWYRGDVEKGENREVGNGGGIWGRLRRR